MENTKLKPEGVCIVDAVPADAPLISRVIMMALGVELCESFATGGRTLDDVEALFTRCAQCDDSQYSWVNTVKAVDGAGNICGLAVSYDGAKLHELRRRFLDEFALMNGFRIDDRMTDETDAGEWYLDSLAVFPEYRGMGLASLLIDAVAERARKGGKPLGLLVDKTNGRAEALYRRVGFEPVGDRPFAGEIMTHMQRH